MVDEYEIKVPDIEPFGFTIEIVDGEQEPVAGVKFNVTVDDEDAITMETDESGILRVQKPEREINLAYASSE